ncbi:MAG TPA: 50S ribosomal protein L5 [Firmicutes bacterium]|jgi:large subunit ribosomal protein L5|nr:50S ribosomal protein L5 [Bacillota bacterium]
MATETKKPVAKKSAEAALKDAGKKEKIVAEKIPARLIEKYRTTVVPSMMKKFGYTSVMQVPALHKIVINIGVGDAITNAKLLEDSVRELAEITGQKPVITKAKISIANFKLREGQAIGCKVTLRGERMYHFFDKLVSIALPRVRDFRGVSKNAFDGRGNYTLGIKEQLIFPEINFDKVNKIRGMDIIIVTTANTDAEAFALLSELGVPFQK